MNEAATTATELDAQGMFVNWLFFVILLAIILVPTQIFRRIALNVGRNGWLFMGVGLGVGFVSLNIARLALVALSQLEMLKDQRWLLFLVIPVIGFGLDAIAIGVLRKNLRPKEN